MPSNTLPAAVQFGETSLAIIDRDGRPWLAAADLARALEYADDRSVSRIYRRNESEFSESMSVVVTLTPTSGVPTQTRIFSPRGCHLIAMFARTARAAAFRRWVLDVLEGLASPAANAPSIGIEKISEAQQQALQEAVGEVVAAGVQTWGETWARLHRKFRIPRYAELPASQFTEALAYLHAKLPEESERESVARDRLSQGRFLVRFDSAGGMTLREVPESAVILPPDAIAKVIGEPGSVVSPTLLPEIIEAAAKRLTKSLPR